MSEPRYKLWRDPEPGDELWSRYHEPPIEVLSINLHVGKFRYQLNVDHHDRTEIWGLWKEDELFFTGYQIFKDILNGRLEHDDSRIIEVQEE